MLLIDRNNEPTSTVYYLAAIAYGHLLDCGSMDAASLFTHISENVIKQKINYEFFVMALDFLYLLDKVMVDEKGELHVYRISEAS